MSKTIRIPDPFAPFSPGGRPTTAGDYYKHVMTASMTPESIKATAPVRNKPALTPKKPSEIEKSITSGKKTGSPSKTTNTSPVKDNTVVSSPHSGEWKKHHLSPKDSYLLPNGVLINPNVAPIKRERYPELATADKLKTSSYV